MYKTLDEHQEAETLQKENTTLIGLLFAHFFDEEKATKFS